MDKFEILWCSLKQWLMDEQEEKVLKYMDEQEKAYGVAADLLNNTPESPEEVLLDVNAFLDSLLDISGATEEQRKEIHDLMEKENG